MATEFIKKKFISDHPKICLHFCGNGELVVFLHGIGGGKYDQLTDDIAEQFLGVSLPRIQIATSTIKLFEQQFVDPQQELDVVKQDLRALKFSPDKVALKAIENGHKAGTQLAQLMEDKRQHVQQTVPPEQRPAWHQTLQEICQQAAWARPLHMGTAMPGCYDEGP